MSRKKHRYKDLQPKPPAKEHAPQPKVDEPEEQNITRYKAVVRSPQGEWWHDNKKRIRLFAMIGGGGLAAGWLIFELFNLIF